MAVSCGMRAVCSACSHAGHSRHECNDFARAHGLVWRQSSLQQNTSISESSADQGKGARVIGISSPITSPPPTLFQSPRIPAKETSCPSKENLYSSPLQPAMENFELDPHRLPPGGHHIIDGEDRRLPRTFFTHANLPPRRHEDYMVAEVMPAPNGPLGPVRE